MASVLDHRHFRDTQENLTALHDAWMHNSTGTSNTTQGIYEHGSEPGVAFSPNDVPESHSALLGFSPSDISTFIGSRGGPPPIKSGGNVNPLAQQGQGGNGGSGCGQGQCDLGGGHCGSGCVCCPTPQQVENCYADPNGTDCNYQAGPNAKGGGGGKGGGKGSVHKGHSKSKSHGRGGGGTKAQGANAIGKIPTLGNVPYSATPSGGTSPIMVILLLGGAGLLIYFIWHKLRKSKAEDKEMSEKGE